MHELFVNTCTTRTLSLSVSLSVNQYYIKYTCCVAVTQVKNILHVFYRQKKHFDMRNTLGCSHTFCIVNCKKSSWTMISEAVTHHSAQQTVR